MQRSEIVEGLQAILDDVLEDELTDRQLEPLHQAINLLTPEPITEDGLRGLGWKDGGRGVLYSEVKGAGIPWLSYRNGHFALHACGAPLTIHITDMQHLRSVIAALEGGGMNESIFGRHMTNADGGIVRQFYNGATRREEAWLERNVEGRERASWTVYHTWDIRDNGQMTDANKFHDHDAALADYNRRVSELQAASYPEFPDSSTSESESPDGQC